MTGVTDLAQLVAVPRGHRPSFVAADLSGLLESHPAVQVRGGEIVVGGWRAVLSSGRLELRGEGSQGDWWRAVASAGWLALDESGESPDTRHLEPPSAEPRGLGR